MCIRDRKIYGDSSLWFVIADANGILLDEELEANRELKIPNVISGSKTNDFETFKPYNPTEIIGDITPRPEPPPPPKKKDKCGGLLTIVIIVVAVVATVMTAGAAIAAVSPALGGAATGLGGMAQLGAAALAGSHGAGMAVIAGLAGGAGGSIASQLVGMATGLQLSLIHI